VDRRLFFALWPNRQQRDAIRHTLDPLLQLLEGKVVPRENWHVTLLFIGNFPVERIPALEAAVHDIRAAPFRIRFEQLSFWPKPRIACLEASTVPPALHLLVSRLREVAGKFDIPLDERAYRPHVTAIRSVRPFESRALAQPLELSWSGFRLLESVSTLAGVRNRPVKQELPRTS
jgi:2'-5' RNA ligase